MGAPKPNPITLTLTPNKILSHLLRPKTLTLGLWSQFSFSLFIPGPGRAARLLRSRATTNTINATNHELDGRCASRISSKFRPCAWNENGARGPVGYQPTTMNHKSHIFTNGNEKPRFAWRAPRRTAHCCFAAAASRGLTTLGLPGCAAPFYVSLRSEQRNMNKA